MNPFLAYGPALIAMAGFALLTLAIAPIAAMRKAREGVVSGASPTPDYADPTYRLFRAHLNATEIIGAFVAVIVAAMLAGAAPFWVNLFAALFLVSRIAHAATHIAGIGAPNYGPRTVLFVFGWAMCAMLAGLAIHAVLTAAG